MVFRGITTSLISQGKLTAEKPVRSRAPEIQRIGRIERMKVIRPVA